MGSSNGVEVLVKRKNFTPYGIRTRNRPGLSPGSWEKWLRYIACGGGKRRLGESRVAYEETNIPAVYFCWSIINMDDVNSPETS